MYEIHVKILSNSIHIKVINRIKNITVLLMIIKKYFGAAGISDYKIHKDEARKQRYINRHKRNETWTKSGIDIPGWWSYKFLWSYPTKEEVYNHIKKDLKKWGVI